MAGQPADPIGAGPRRPGRIPGWAVAAAVLLGLLGVARLTSGESKRPTPPPPAPSASAAQPPAPFASKTTPLSGHGAPLPAVGGTPVDLATTRAALFVVQAGPGRLLRITGPGRPAVSRALASDPSGVAADDGAGLVWVWWSGTADPAATITPTATVRAYRSADLAPVGTVRLPCGQVHDAAAYAGRLWLATATGLVATAPDRPVGSGDPLAGVGPDVFTVAAAPAQHLVVVGTVDGRFAAVDPVSRTVRSSRSTGLSKPSVATSGADVWFTGYRARGPHSVHLYGADLDPAEPPAPATVDGGPGLLAWSGASVVWLRDGGSETLYCLDAATGTLLAEWADVGGPVASRRGAAYAVAAGGVVRLTLPRRCTG